MREDADHALAVALQAEYDESGHVLKGRFTFSTTFHPGFFDEVKPLFVL